MTTAIGPARLGFPRADAATVHDEMKRLRNLLLAVGLEELQTPESYDASEGSDESGIPTVHGEQSKYMYFAFTDAMQVEAPVYFGICIFFNHYFNTYSTSPSLYVMNIMVSRAIEDGIPHKGDALFSFQPGGVSTSNGGGKRSTLYGKTSLGDYVKYDGTTLFVSFGLDAHEVSISTSEEAVPRCSAFILLSRVGRNLVAVLDSRGYTNTPWTLATLHLFTAPLSNIRSTNGASFARAGGFKYEAGVPIVAPVYGLDEYGVIGTLKGIYTIPSTMETPPENGKFIRLSFSGEERVYIYVKPSTLCPGSTDQGWLIEWQ